MAIKDKLWGFGIVGTIVSALYRFTPVLVWLLSGLGLSGLLGYVYRDTILIPVMAIFLAITRYALLRTNRAR